MSKILILIYQENVAEEKNHSEKYPRGKVVWERSGGKLSREKKFGCERVEWKIVSESIVKDSNPS